MREQIEVLQQKAEALAYQIESFGDLGAERELVEVQKDLRRLKTQWARSRTSRPGRRLQLIA